MTHLHSIGRKIDLCDSLAETLGSLKFAINFRDATVIHGDLDKIDAANESLTRIIKKAEKLLAEYKEL